MNKRPPLVAWRRERYLSNGRTSKTAVGGPFELGDSFLFGGTDSTPERSHTLTAATGVGLSGMQPREITITCVLSA